MFAFVGAGSVLDKLIMYKEGYNMDNVISSFHTRDKGRSDLQSECW